MVRYSSRQVTARDLKALTGYGSRNPLREQVMSAFDSDNVSEEAQFQLDPEQAQEPLAS